MYAEKQRWTCVNVSDWQVEQFPELFESMQKFLTLTVSVAGKAWKLLDNTQQHAYLSFLQRKNLIDNVEIVQKRLNNVIN